MTVSLTPRSTTTPIPAPAAQMSVHVPLFTVELGRTEHDTVLLIDLLSPRWQALLQSGPPAATVFFWQQVIRSLSDRHWYPEVQIVLFTQRPGAYAWHLLGWDPHWMVTSHPPQFVQAVFRAYESRHLPGAPAVHLFLVDDLLALLESVSNGRLLQIAFLEGVRQELRLMGSLNTPNALLPEHPLTQCFTNTVKYLGHGWYGLMRRSDLLRFRLSIGAFHLPQSNRQLEG